MPLLFSYGSLQEEAVQLSTFGRRLDGERAELLRFEGSFVKIDDPQEAAATGKTHHANITFNGNDDSRVPGMVFEISDTELAGADEYEAAFSYERVAAVLASGGPVWVYVHPQGALATLRLTLRPCFPAHILSLIEQPERFRRLTGLPAAAGLREMFTAHDVSPEWVAALRESRAVDPWRHGFFVVHTGAAAVIGTAGFKGPPDSTGTVEIAYGVAPEFEGQGYATEAAAALVAFAFDTPRVELVCAHTLPAANASTRVLAKCGFRHAGTVVDPDDGPVWRWERSRR